MRVVVTVCSRGRPLMLRNCLQSLVEQDLPPGVTLTLVVVENDSEPFGRESVTGFAGRRASPEIIYAHEPILGIPVARNRALALALDQDPDWIGFIDDDEIAPKSWVRHFLDAANVAPADVFQGPVDYRYPADTPAWMPLPTRKSRKTGQALRNASTSNTFMRSFIARPDGLGLKFNEAMRFTGGSDLEYFQRARDQGARLCWMDEAEVSEAVPASRTTIRWYLARARRVASNAMFVQIDRSGRTLAVIGHAPSYVGKILQGAAMTVPAIVMLPFASVAGRRLLISGMHKIASGVGGLGAFFGVQPQPYKVIDGY